MFARQCVVNKSVPNFMKSYEVFSLWCYVMDGQTKSDRWVWSPYNSFLFNS